MTGTNTIATENKNKTKNVSSKKRWKTKYLQKLFFNIKMVFSLPYSRYYVYCMYSSFLFFFLLFTKKILVYTGSEFASVCVHSIFCAVHFFRFFCLWCGVVRALVVSTSQNMSIPTWIDLQNIWQATAWKRLFCFNVFTAIFFLVLSLDKLEWKSLHQIHSGYFFAVFYASNSNWTTLFIFFICNFLMISFFLFFLDCIRLFLPLKKSNEN